MKVHELKVKIQVDQKAYLSERLVTRLTIVQSKYPISLIITRVSKNLIRLLYFFFLSTQPLFAIPTSHSTLSSLFDVGIERKRGQKNKRRTPTFLLLAKICQEKTKVWGKENVTLRPVPANDDDQHRECR